MLNGSPGLVVMDDDLCLIGRRFKSWRRIGWMEIFALICCKNSIACLKIPKMNDKRGWVGPLFKKRRESPPKSCCLECEPFVVAR